MYFLRMTEALGDRQWLKTVARLRTADRVAEVEVSGPTSQLFAASALVGVCHLELRFC